MLKKFKKVIAIMLATCCIVSAVSMPTSAATAKTATKSNTVTSYKGLVKALDMYAKDVFKIKYDGKRVISCSVTQKKADYGSGILKASGVKCIKVTESSQIYQTVWKINFNVLPGFMITKVKQVAPELLPLIGVGTIVKGTYTYEVKANGTVVRKSAKIQYLTTIKKYLKFVKKYIYFV